MRKTLLALCSTAAGIAALVGLKAQSAGTPRSALADLPATRPGVSPTGGTRAPGSAPTGRYTGTAVATRYGPMQVRAVLHQGKLVDHQGKLVDVTVLQQTFGGRSSQIDSYALPILRSEALKAQDARIDVVSGATYTSEGYARSLQAALDAAGR